MKNSFTRENVQDSAPEKRLMLVDTKSISSFRKSSNEIKKQFQILAKGHNVTYEIINRLEHMRDANEAVESHVPENGRTDRITCAAPCSAARRLLDRTDV
jgi:hypothetical protein